jgi:hypothetical protein
MKRRSRDEEREQRITMEIIVDAYTPEEQAMGWYYADEVEVVGMAPEEECGHEMFVLIRWDRRGLAVPLAQLEGVAVDDQTRQVIEDWHYWVAQGYEL